MKIWIWCRGSIERCVHNGSHWHSCSTEYEIHSPVFLFFCCFLLLSVNLYWMRECERLDELKCEFEYWWTLYNNNNNTSKNKMIKSSERFQLDAKTTPFTIENNDCGRMWWLACIVKKESCEFVTPASRSVAASISIVLIRFFCLLQFFVCFAINLNALNFIGNDLSRLSPSFAHHYVCQTLNRIYVPFCSTGLIVVSICRYFLSFTRFRFVRSHPFSINLRDVAAFRLGMWAVCCRTNIHVMQILMR